MTGASPAPASGSGFRFPQSSRLRKSRDFQFRPYQRFHSERFRFVYTSSGQGRLGVSLSRKVLRRAVARNRVRRLLREAFRLRPGLFRHADVHVIGQPALAELWCRLTLDDVGSELDALARRLPVALGVRAAEAVSGIPSRIGAEAVFGKEA